MHIDTSGGGGGTCAQTGSAACGSRQCARPSRSAWQLSGAIGSAAGGSLPQRTTAASFVRSASNT
jgi:hypothetical protein